MNFPDESLKVLHAQQLVKAGFAESDQGSSLDVHKVKAAHDLGISYDEVTPEQRRAAKERSFGEIYSMPMNNVKILDEE